MSFLIITLDLESLLSGLHLNKAKIDLNTVIGSLVIFFNAYSLLNRDNKLAVIGFSCGGVDILYPDIYEQTGDMVNFQSSATSIREVFSRKVSLSLKNISADTSNISGGSKLHSALSSALSLFHHHQTVGFTSQMRILNIQFDKDLPQSYNSVMNTIFRYEVVVFVFLFFGFLIFLYYCFLVLKSLELFWIHLFYHHMNHC
jgi:hypothetical protein